MFSIHSLHTQAAIAGTSSSYSQLLSGLFRLARLNRDQAPTALPPAPCQIRLDRPLTGSCSCRRMGSCGQFCTQIEVLDAQTPDGGRLYS